MSIVAHPHQQIGDIAVHGTAHLRPLEVDVGLRDLLLGGVEGRLRLDGVTDIQLLLLRRRGEMILGLAS
jgi:hypothetical protein